ncbi:hypothetical protein MJI37_35970, partial [Salmonella enterica subsp. enterica serovar Cerro]|nr:hypothetical protein [Salmonella enterica subsp. enterica serovar Cerro]
AAYDAGQAPKPNIHGNERCQNIVRYEMFKKLGYFVTESSEHFGLNIVHVPAEERFLSALAGENDPEAKRKIIGRVFVEVFDE